MLINLDNTNAIPLYRQIVDGIRDKILVGQLKPGDPLPSIRQLAADLLVSVITTKRAYMDLENEGLIQTRPGRGTFIGEVSDEHLRDVGAKEVAEKLLDAVRTARRLGVPPTEVFNLLKTALESESIDG